MCIYYEEIIAIRSVKRLLTSKREKMHLNNMRGATLLKGRL